MKKELTIELTDYCPEDCKFCSSDAVKDKSEAKFIDPKDIGRGLIEKPKDIAQYVTAYDGGDKPWDTIHISGGEPLAHPQFYEILQMCKKISKDVIVHSNAITHLAYNPHVIDGVYLEAYLTVPTETDKVHILRSVKQGREENRPEVQVSKNWSQECECEHRVVRPDGTITKSPCSKWEEDK